MLEQLAYLPKLLEIVDQIQFLTQLHQLVAAVAAPHILKQKNVLKMVAQAAEEVGQIVLLYLEVVILHQHLHHKAITEVQEAAEEIMLVVAVAALVVLVAMLQGAHRVLMVGLEHHHL